MLINLPLGDETKLSNNTHGFYRMMDPSLTSEFGWIDWMQILDSHLTLPGPWTYYRY